MVVAGTMRAMLVARGKIELGDVVYATTLVLERRFRIYIEERTGTIWDTRFVRPRPGDGSERAVVYALLDGWHDWPGQPLGSIAAPAVFVTSQGAVDGIRGEAFTRAAGGAPFRSVQLRLMDGRGLDDEAPRLLDGAGPLLEAARAIVDAGDDQLGAPVSAFVTACSDAGLAPSDLASSISAEESRNLTRIWNAIRAPHLLVARFPALDQVADLAGVSTRHAARALDEMFAAFRLEWGGWRDVVNDLRLRCAVVLLSAPSISVDEVARSAGYGGATALGAALRKAGLPGPRQLRSLILLREEERVARLGPLAQLQL